MSARRHHRLLRIAAPWIAGLLLLAIALWIWDSKNYPVPEMLDPDATPASTRSLPQAAVLALRESKEKRYWSSFVFEGTRWKAVDLGSQYIWNLRFSDSKIFVDHTGPKNQMPFADGSEYEWDGYRTIHGWRWTAGDGGSFVAVPSEATLFRVKDDGWIHIFNGVSSFDFKLIQQGQVADPALLNPNHAD